MIAKTELTKLLDQEIESSIFSRTTIWVAGLLFLFLFNLLFLHKAEATSINHSISGLEETLKAYQAMAEERGLKDESRQLLAQMEASTRRNSRDSNLRKMASQNLEKDGFIKLKAPKSRKKPGCKVQRTDWGEVVDDCLYTEEELYIVDLIEKGDYEGAEQAMVAFSQGKTCADLRSGDQLGPATNHKVLFGDGDPTNGFEDDRESLETARSVKASVPRSSGIVECNYTKKVEGPDGITQELPFVMKGSASLVYVGDNSYSTLVGSGHVMYNTDGSARKCSFLPSGDFHARVEIPVKDRKTFYRSVADEMTERDIVFAKMPFALRSKYGGMTFKHLDEDLVQKFVAAGAKFELIAYNQHAGEMSVSRSHCTVVKKRPGDINFGKSGLYSHSCDTNGGSSGGMLVVSYNGDSIILGFHAGLKLNPKVYKIDKEKYPDTDGFPEGVVFDPTNAVGVAVNMGGQYAQKLMAQFKNKNFKN